MTEKKDAPPAKDVPAKVDEKKPEPAKSDDVKKDSPVVQASPESDQPEGEKELVVNGNKTRWVAGVFFDGGTTKNPRLDERYNFLNPNDPTVTDTSDVGIASEILRRANLVDRVYYRKLLEIFANALGSIEDPLKFANPHHGVNKRNVG